MAILAEAYINWGALWKIIVVSLVGGAGVVVVFGFLLLAVKRAQASKSEGSKVANYALGGLCGVICVGAIAIGIVAMADKPASKAKSSAKSKSAAVYTAPASGRSLVASTG